MIARRHAVDSQSDDAAPADPTDPVEAEDSASPAASAGDATPVPDAAKRAEHRSMESVRREVLEWVGVGWEEVLARFGAPDQCAPGEWDYAGKDGDPGRVFLFEQGRVKDGGALDPDWRPAGRDAAGADGR